MRSYKAPFIDIECAIAQLLLKIRPQDLEDRIGPIFEDAVDGGRNRIFTTFGTEVYAQEMQGFINEFIVDTEAKPLVLAISVWLDKAPMNSSMSRSAVPVVIRVMNDLTNNPFVIGYAPEDLPMDCDLLKLFMEKGKYYKSIYV